MWATEAFHSRRTRSPKPAIPDAPPAHTIVGSTTSPLNSVPPVSEFPIFSTASTANLSNRLRPCDSAARGDLKSQLCHFNHPAAGGFHGFRRVPRSPATAIRYEDLEQGSRSTDRLEA